MSKILENIDKLIDYKINTKQFPVLAKVENVSNKKYLCTCRLLDRLGNESETIVINVKIPKLWGSKSGGIWALPEKNSIVLLNFQDGDINFPIIAAVIGSTHQEQSSKDSLIIKQNNVELLVNKKKISLKKGNTRIDIGSKICIETNGINVGKMLDQMINMIKNIKVLTADGPFGLDPAQLILWGTFSEQMAQIWDTTPTDS